MVVKPAKATPLSCFRLVQILREAGLPDEWCQPLVTVDHDSANQIVADPRVAFFTFIGSGEVGWRLRRQLAPGTRCSLEHGGVAPVIVAADADLDLRSAAVGERRLLSCRAGLCFRAANLRRPADRPGVGRADRLGRRAG